MDYLFVLITPPICYLLYRDSRNKRDRKALLEENGMLSGIMYDKLYVSNLLTFYNYSHHKRLNTRAYEEHVYVSWFILKVLPSELSTCEWHATTYTKIKIISRGKTSIK